MAIQTASAVRPSTTVTGKGSDTVGEVTPWGLAAALVLVELINLAWSQSAGGSGVGLICKLTILALAHGVGDATSWCLADWIVRRDDRYCRTNMSTHKG